jgi:fibronectin type 3 domain-containing protein
LSWLPVEDALIYNIYWSTSSDITTANGNKVFCASNPYHHINLTNGTTYYYIVTSENADGESAASAPLNATPAFSPPPAAPTGVVLTPSSCQVELRWTPVEGALNYNVYWSTTSGITTSNGNKIINSSNPYNHNNLTNGTTYYYIVTAVNADGESTASAPLNATPVFNPPPSSPTGVIVTPGNGQIALSWISVDKAMTYNVYWSNSSDITTSNGHKIFSASNPYNHINLTNGTAYYYIVTAVNADGESMPSSPGNATPVYSPPPAAPINVSADPGNGQVSVSWSPVEGASSYTVYYSMSPDAEDSNAVSTESPRVIDGLDNFKLYYFTVKARNDNGESASSVQVSAIPAPNPSPSSPMNITAAPGSASVTVSWQSVTGAVSYNLYYSTSAGSLGTKITSATSPRIVTGLTNFTSYYFTVTAVNIYGESTVPKQVAAMPNVLPAAPVNLIATPGNGSMSLTWNATSNAVSYNIYWSTTQGVTISNGNKINVSTNSYTHTDLTNGTMYYYIVTAQNIAGESSASSEEYNFPSVTPAPARPRNLSAYQPGIDGTILVSWSGTTGATSYNLYWSNSPGVTTTSGTKISGITSITYSHTDLSRGSTYYYIVTAQNASAESLSTNEASVLIYGLSALGSGMDSTVSALVFDSDGNLYAGGNFTKAGGVTVNYIAKWNGTIWSALGSGMNGCVRSLAFDSSGNLYAGGSFTTAGGISANQIAKWDGSWSALTSGVTGGSCQGLNGVNSIVIDSNDHLYAGGCFAVAGGFTTNNIAKWDGSAWSAMGTGFLHSGTPPAYGHVMDLNFDFSGNLYAAGSFTSAGGVSAYCIAKWDTAGSSWSSIGFNSTSMPDSSQVSVDSLAFDLTGNFYAGGNINGYIYNSPSSYGKYIIKWDGSRWVLPFSLNSAVHDFTTDSAGNIYTGGYFTTAGGITVNYIVKWGL